MMTKEEFIENAIECRKENDHFLIKKWCCLLNDEDGTCQGCPVNYDNVCNEDDLFLDEIIRLREEKTERVETNLEHYYYAYDYLSTTQNLDDVYERITVEFKKGAYDSYTKSNVGILDWLLSPYEPPKKYQMTQLCYDIIKRYVETCENPKAILKFTVFYDVLRVLDFYEESWKEIRLEDLLENAEVVEE